MPMNPNIFKRNELLAQKVIKGLESRNMTGYYAASKEEALKLALSLIPEYSTVTMGGAMSAHEIGLVDAVKSGNYHFIDRDAMEDKRAAMLAAYDADVFLASTNAMTDDGMTGSSSISTGTPTVSPPSARGRSRCSSSWA